MIDASFSESNGVLAVTSCSIRRVYAPTSENSGANPASINGLLSAFRDQYHGTTPEIDKLVTADTLEAAVSGKAQAGSQGDGSGTTATVNGNAQAGNQGNGSGGTSRQFCVGIQPDLGLYYLPLDKTKARSEKVEGYGDISILIPLSNLNFSDFQLVQADGLLNSQIHIKWSDSVNAANNYARTRQWTFGIEIMK